MGFHVQRVLSQPRTNPPSTQVKGAHCAEVKHIRNKIQDPAQPRWHSQQILPYSFEAEEAEAARARARATAKCRSQRLLQEKEKKHEIETRWYNVNRATGKAQRALSPGPERYVLLSITFKKLVVTHLSFFFTF